MSFQNISLRLQGTEIPIWVLLDVGNKAGTHNMQTSGPVGEEKTYFVIQILYSDAVSKVQLAGTGFCFLYYDYFRK